MLCVLISGVNVTDGRKWTCTDGGKWTCPVKLFISGFFFSFYFFDRRKNIATTGNLNKLMIYSYFASSASSVAHCGHVFFVHYQTGNLHFTEVIDLKLSACHKSLTQIAQCVLIQLFVIHLFLWVHCGLLSVTIWL